MKRVAFLVLFFAGIFGLVVWTKDSPWAPIICFLLGAIMIHVYRERETIYLKGQLREAIEERDEALRAASTDPLTGLFNRRGMLSLTQKILGAQMRLVHESQNDLWVTVSAIDLDGFKAVNDTLGHGAGDAIIRLVSELLRRYFGRGTDIVCRLGGDEFLVLTIGTDDVGLTASRLEAFRQVLAQEVTRLLQGQLPVTASCGVKAVPVPEEGGIDLGSLAGLADALMYQAKQGGKNRVVVG